jgi:hypothetical protein
MSGQSSDRRRHLHHHVGADRRGHRGSLPLGATAMIHTVHQLDELPMGTKIREVREGVRWIKVGVRTWRYLDGFVPPAPNCQVHQPLLPAEVVLW